MKHLIIWIFSFLAVSFPLTSFSNEQLKVVVTFSILEDLAKNIGGDKIIVRTLVGRDGDAHVYNPTPSDAKAIASADLVIVNGLQFEGWIEKLVQKSGLKGELVIATKGVSTISLNKGSHKYENHHHDSYDPHAWHNVRNVIVYMDNIKNALINKDKVNKSYYLDNYNKYKNELLELDRWIKNEFSKISKEKRKVITSHDAFGYYEREYEVEFYAPRE